MHLFPGTRPILLVGKHMKKLAVAAAVTALFGAGLSAQQAAKTRSAQTPSPAPKLAASHPSANASAISVDVQNKLVAQNCAGCHSEKMKAGQLVLAGFDAAK